MPTQRPVAAAAIVAAFCGLMAFALPAQAAEVNTFRGVCTGVTGQANWPTGMHTVPATIPLHVSFGGGACSGTLNGVRIAREPIHEGTFDVSGPMGCFGGVATGRGAFTLAGKRFGGAARYTRGGATPLVTLDGDAGGRSVSAARAVVGPDNFADFLRGCNGAGLFQLGLDLQSVAPVAISSPAT